MICESAILKGAVEIGHFPPLVFLRPHSPRLSLSPCPQLSGDQTVIHPCCVVIAEKGSSITIGEGNIIEERSQLLNSSLGMASLIGVAAHVSNSIIGSYCQIGPKCHISNSVIGNCCVIAPMVHLNGVTIPENTSVFPSAESAGGWRTAPLQIDTLVSHTVIFSPPFISLFTLYSIQLSQSIAGRYRHQISTHSSVAITSFSAHDSFKMSDCVAGEVWVGDG
jgi:hypothetical protein